MVDGWIILDKPLTLGSTQGVAAVKPESPAPGACAGTEPKAAGGERELAKLPEGMPAGCERRGLNLAAVLKRSQYPKGLTYQDAIAKIERLIHRTRARLEALQEMREELVL